MADVTTDRRGMLSLMGAMMPLVLAGGAQASPIDRRITQYTLPEDLSWHPQGDAPPKSIELVRLYGDHAKAGIYYELVKWYPGFMSAPHNYATDRLCVVLSGTWWINSGSDFDPAHTVPVPAGTFVHRIARTWHYDGVPRGKPEPVTIAICGMGPVDMHLAEPGKGLVRRV